MTIAGSPREIDELLVRLDAALADGAHDHHIEGNSRIGIELCEYWQDLRHDAVRLKYVAGIGNRRVAYVKAGAVGPVGAYVNQ